MNGNEPKLPPLSTARALRLSARLTQAELGAKVGVTSQAISLAERAPELHLSASLAAKLAPILGCSPSDLTPRAARGKDPA